MSSTSADRPTWRRKRDQKRSETRAQRTENYRQQLRREGATRGIKGVAEAEFNIVRSVIGALPEHRRDEEWKALAAVLRQLGQGLSSRHKQ
ncbi:hypothetical protein ACGFYY_32635 [Streptomyces sp. NPDC048331]|uniref:hypothetical protein n=1 Tax=Streptomyces sp. NPDC048331 TaxID=3365534 RepID=UPI003717E4DE